MPNLFSPGNDTLNVDAAYVSMEVKMPSKLHPTPPAVAKAKMLDPSQESFPRCCFCKHGDKHALKVASNSS